MKQKTNSAMWVLVLIGFAATSWVANHIYDWKNAVSPYQANVPTQFYAGMDKFLSNVSWMTLVQWQADDLRMKSADAGEKLYEKLNALTNLDPLFIDAYLDGALSLAASHPDQAVKLLEKAMRTGATESNWKIPFYAGQIRLMNSKDPDAAINYLEMARKIPDVPNYIESTILRARCLKVNDEPVESAKIWYEYYAHIEGPDAHSLRATAAAQITEYTDAALADLDTQLKAATDADKRAKLEADKAVVMKISKDVAGTTPVAPTSQPAI